MAAQQDCFTGRKRGQLLWLPGIQMSKAEWDYGRRLHLEFKEQIRVQAILPQGREQAVFNA